MRDHSGYVTPAGYSGYQTSTGTAERGYVTSGGYSGYESASGRA